MNGIFRANPVSIPQALALVTGVIAAQQFAVLPPPWAIALAAATAAGWLARQHSLLAAGVLGLCWALALGSLRMADVLPADWERQSILAEGVIETLPDALDQDGLRFVFRPDSIISPAAVPLPSRWRLSWFKNAAPLKAGQRWRLRVRLKRPHGLFNPGGMDYELWLFSHGIGAIGYVREDGQNRKLADPAPWSLAAWRQAVFDRIGQSVAGREMAGIVLALTMGEESAITPEQWEVLRRTGTAHLVAISGSHISLIAGLVFMLAGRLCAAFGLMRWSPPQVAAVAAIFSAWLYSALAGFPIPTQRALIMIVVAMAGVIAQRQLRPVAVLALALLAVAVYDPPAVLSVGFWLSYGAVALILFALAGRLRGAGWWRELWAINWATSLGLAPLLLLFFQQVSLASPLANLFAVPTIGLILTPLCLLGALLLPVYAPAGEWLLRLAATALDYVWIVLQGLSDQPWAQWNHAAPPLYALPFALLGVGLLLAPRGIPARWLGLVLLIPALTLRPSPPAEGQFRLTLLDVGQGLAAAVQTARHTLIFDTGPRLGKHFDTGAAVVEPFLRQHGVDTIDLLIISHGDNDHIGGAASLLQQFNVVRTLTSVPAQLPQAHAEACRAGQHFRWDGVDFTLLAPLADLGGDNNNSCVLQIRAATGSALLTGDIERNAEQRLLEHYGANLQADILIAPHHGSKTSSSSSFLDAVQPKIVLIPAGYLNRFNFPHPDVLRRYRLRHAQILNTADSGAISIEPGEPPQTYRQLKGKYWNARE